MGIKLYLVQHGEAVPDAENPERPLTPRGREDIRRLAAFLAEAVAEWQDDTLVVGHQPFMSRLVSRLLLGREQPTIVEFTPGTIACLARRPVTGAWYLAWVLAPELLRR